MEGGRPLPRAVEPGVGTESSGLTRECPARPMVRAGKGVVWGRLGSPQSTSTTSRPILRCSGGTGGPGSEHPTCGQPGCLPQSRELSSARAQGTSRLSVRVEGLQPWPPQGPAPAPLPGPREQAPSERLSCCWGPWAQGQEPGWLVAGGLGGWGPAGFSRVACSLCRIARWPLARMCCHARLCGPVWSARLLRPRDSPGKNIGVGCHFLLQGIFPTQGWNPRPSAASKTNPDGRGTRR